MEPKQNEPTCHIFCDLAIDEVVLMHRWPRPVQIGSRCACGERTADAATVSAINAVDEDDVDAGEE